MSDAENFLTSEPDAGLGVPLVREQVKTSKLPLEGA